MRVVFSVEEGFGEVRVAASGEDAVSIAGDFEPDVIFLDYWMPAMDGGETASALREMHPEARIVAFSGVIEDKPEWADEYVVKGRTHSLDRIVDLARGE